MIKTTLGIDLDYSTLERILHERLNTNPDSVSSLKIRCFSRDESIVIIVEHPEDVISHPRRIFRVIRNLAQEKKIVGEVLMYLVVHGKDKPQFFNQITLYSPTDSKTEVHKGKNSQNSTGRFSDFIPKKRENKSSLVTIILATLLSLLGVSVLGYLLSRPCVIGKCLLLTESKKSAEDSLSIIAENKPSISLINIKQQLTESIEKLKVIPAWSKHYSEAEELSKNYQLEIKKIDKAIQAIQLGDQAKSMLKNQPLSKQKWQEVVNLWENAISIFQEISDKNPNSFFTKKQQEYENNLANVKAKLEQEEEAQKSLLVAQDAAKLAQSRQTSVKSLADLQQVEATWKTAIAKLETIPIETTAYRKKQELLDIYISKLVEAQQNTKQEEVATNLYDQALNQRQRAKNYAGNNQWSLAVSAWQNTIRYLEQMSAQSLQYQEGIKLLNSSREELIKAEAKSKIEQAKNDLKNTCSSFTTICNYSVESNVIKVFLTNSYIQTIQQLTDPSADAKNNQQIMNNISQVESNLKSISSKYQIPLEVYNPEGDLMTKYQP